MHRFLLICIIIVWAIIPNARAEINVAEMAGVSRYVDLHGNQIIPYPSAVLQFHLIQLPLHDGQLLRGSIASVIGKPFGLMIEASGIYGESERGGESNGHEKNHRIFTTCFLLFTSGVLFFVSHKFVSNAVQRADYLHVVFVLIGVPIFWGGCFVFLYAIGVDLPFEELMP